MSLKSKTIKGLSWSFLDRIASQITQFVFGIILARLLAPEEYGLLGMLAIFMSISGVFIYSGFGEALIRKANVKQIDYSTVFVFNLLVSILFYVLLFISSSLIASFFKESVLSEITKVFALILIFDAIGIIPRTILTKNVDFKSQAKVAVVASIISGIVGITLAFLGYGVWSLVIKSLLRSFLGSVLLWIFSNWQISLKFDVNSFREMFRFSSRLLASGLINQIFRNVYYFVIGRYYSAAQLGFYTKAQSFNSLFSSQLDGIVQRVSYPVLANLQNDPVKLKMAYKRLIKSTMLISFSLMMGMAALAEPMIITLIGEQWKQSVIYLQLLCFSGMLYPLHSLNLNMLNVKGRSDLFLKLEIFKKSLAVPGIMVGIFYGIELMLALGIVNTWIAYYINSYWSGKLANYPMKEQFLDILPSMIIAFVSALIVYFAGLLLPLGYFAKLVLLTLLGAFLIISLCEITRNEAYSFLKEIVVEKITSFKNG